MPHKTPTPYTVARIFKFSFIFLFILNNTTIPIPAPVSNPDIIEAKLTVPSIYNSVSSTDEAQLGIKPIKLVINGCNIFPSIIIFARLSSPIKYIAKLSTNNINKINKNVFKVCFNTDENK